MNENLEFNILLDEYGIVNIGPCDDIEVSPVRFVDDGHVEVCEEEKDAEFYSVYFHKKSGGAVCLADCQNKQAAENLAALLKVASEQLQMDEYKARLYAAAPELLKSLGEILLKLQEHQTEEKKILKGYTLAANIEGMTELLNNGMRAYAKFVNGK